MLDELKEQVCAANKALAEYGLVTLTFGNASGMDRATGLVAIKPSGVGYASMTPADIVLVDLDGKVIEGARRPSSDTPTHLALYRAFEGIGGVAHAHSTYATAFAQAMQGIPCLGTTHADHFYGDVPVTRPLAEAEIATDYELNTGRVIVESFEGREPLEMPAVLVAHHGPFTWGTDVGEAVDNTVALEDVAKMAAATCSLGGDLPAIPQVLLDRHFRRKHGPNAYYGQKDE